MTIKHTLSGVCLVLFGLGSAQAVPLGTLTAVPTDFSRNFGRIFGFGAPLGPFTDSYEFELTAPFDTVSGGAATFQFGSVSVNLTSITLTGGTLGAAPVIDSTPDQFSIPGLGAGTYTLQVFGSLSDVGTGGQANYSGTIKAFTSVVTPPIPEPSTYALLAMGLCATGLVARRRGSNRAAPVALS